MKKNEHLFLCHNVKTLITPDPVNSSLNFKTGVITKNY